MGDSQGWSWRDSDRLRTITLRVYRRITKVYTISIIVVNVVHTLVGVFFVKRVIIFTVKMKLLPLLATAASTVDPQPCRAFTNKVHINALLSRSSRKHTALRNSTTCKKKGMAVCMYSYSHIGSSCSSSAQI